MFSSCSNCFRWVDSADIYFLFLSWETDPPLLLVLRVWGQRTSLLKPVFDVKCHREMIRVNQTVSERLKHQVLWGFLGDSGQYLPTVVQGRTTSLPATGSWDQGSLMCSPSGVQGHSLFWSVTFLPVCGGGVTGEVPNILTPSWMKK